MTENAGTPAVQDEPVAEPTGPALMSEEWVEKTLENAGIQQDEQSSEEEAPAVAAEQGDESPEAPSEETPAEPAAAPNWREAAIPTDDESVPQHFRGKSANDVWDSYRELESTWNKDRQHMRELEAKVAAQDTVREMLGEKPAEQPQAPTDPYQEAGIDLETTPVLDPKAFYPKQQELILAEAKKMFEAEMDKRAAATTEQQQQEAAVDKVAAAISHVEKERGLDVDTMKARIPSLLMGVNDAFGKDAVGDPAKLLEVHDKIFGAPTPVAPEPIPTTKPVPNPPGAKVPKIVEPAPKVPGIQLKDYERDILDDLEAAMRNNLSPKIAAGINGDRLRARYAANLKKVRG